VATYEGYEQYFGSHLYDSRYPRPNERTLRLVLSASRHTSTVVDIGAGNGRYALPLARRGYQVIAVERSQVAREQLSERVSRAKLASAVEIHAELQDVEPARLASAGTALLLFGVLGHMTYLERAAILSTLSTSMIPGARLLGSVPNRYRRFRHEQVTARIPDGGRAPRFRYGRGEAGERISLEYTAFSPAELRQELVDQGWKGCRLSPESVFPEAVVTSRPWIGRPDGLASNMLPAAAGHCLFYEAGNAEARIVAGTVLPTRSAGAR
jgi:tRNA (uracil-5-)-methyltransferase TRM9